MEQAQQSKRWLEYFQANADQWLEFTPDGYRLTGEEARDIGSSIQAFQIGESSEGAFLRRKADRFAVATGDAHYAECIRLLIREENRHSAYLVHFMKEQGIPLARRNWTDGVFRRLRHLAGLELSLRALVTGELVAVPYYRALAAATRSPQLKAICERMLEEEDLHIRFQMTTLHKIGLQRNPISSSLADILHAGLLAVTACVTWREHRCVLRVKFSFGGFFHCLFDTFRDAMDAGLVAAAADLGCSHLLREIPAAQTPSREPARALVPAGARP